MIFIALEYLSWRSSLEEVLLIMVDPKERSENTRFSIVDISDDVFAVLILLTVENGKLQVNLIDWLKTMVGNRKAEQVVDPKLPEMPSSKALKRALLVALRCCDPDATKRPKMGHVIHMLEADDLLCPDVSSLHLYPYIKHAIKS